MVGVCPPEQSRLWVSMLRFTYRCDKRSLISPCCPMRLHSHVQTQLQYDDAAKSRLPLIHLSLERWFLYDHHHIMCHNAMSGMSPNEMFAFIIVLLGPSRRRVDSSTHADLQLHVAKRNMLANMGTWKIMGVCQRSNADHDHVLITIRMLNNVRGKRHSGICTKVD